MADILAALAAPFPPETISWRVGSTTKDKARGLALAYIDARDVQDRLNQVCGIYWQCRHSDVGGGKLACDIGIKVWHETPSSGEWIWRGDGAGETEVKTEGPTREQQIDMAQKGAFSDAFKRAGVRWGIARYLYDLDSPWVALERKGNSYVIAATELPKLRRLLGGHPMRDPLAAVNATTKAWGAAIDNKDRQIQVKETEMPGGALYEPGAEKEAEVADAKLVADAWIAAGQGRDALYIFCTALSKAEYESIKSLHVEELLPLARKKDDHIEREVQAQLRGQLEETSL
jgi:hypothetical protein